MREVICRRPHLACAQLIWRPGRIHPAHANGAPACMRCRGPAWSTSANSPIALASWSAGAIGDPHALVVLPPVQDTRRSSGCPVLSRSLSCLWVVPVFAGRGSSTPKLRGAQAPPGINFKILLLSTGLSTERAHFSTELEVIHHSIHSHGAAGWVRTPSM